MPARRRGAGGGVVILPGLLLVGFDGHRLKVFGFEDLAAIETLYVVHAISAGEDNRFGMLAGGLHN